LKKRVAIVEDEPALRENYQQALERAGYEDTIESGALVLDLKRMTANWQQQPVALSVTEFWMVHALARHPGHVKSRQQLMEAASVVLDDATITSHIKRIRKKFLVVDDHFDCIETAYGMGYRWQS